MQKSYFLSHPELLTVTKRKKTWRGADQTWYPDSWQQKAGCGPTTAAMLISYLAQTREGCRALYPSGSWEQKDVLCLMETMWTYITPGKRGVHTIEQFEKGLTAFAQECGVVLPLRTLDVPRLRITRPTVDQCLAFLRTALEADAPVAWLNLHNGELAKLDAWHWVTIIGLEEQPGGSALCTILDAGKEFTVDFRLWFQTTKLGGGLVTAGRG